LRARAKGDRIRGPVTFLTAEAETVIRCKGVGEQLYATIEKQRTGKSKLQYCFDIVPIDVPGLDETGGKIIRSAPALVLRAASSGSMGRSMRT
jgi:hypothetical protein